MFEIYCKLRDEKGISDYQVAKATGINRSTFSDWKSGRSEPKHEKLQKIADYFGVSLEYLTTGTEPISRAKERVNHAALRLLWPFAWAFFVPAAFCIIANKRHKKKRHPKGCPLPPYVS